MFVILLLFTCLWIGISTHVPAQEIREGFRQVWNIFEIGIKITTGLIILATLGGLGWLFWLGISHGVIWHSEARIRRAQADGEELRGNLIITVAAPGTQVYASETGKLNLSHKPLYLAPGKVNGKAIEYTQEEMRRWAFFQLTQNISHKPDVTKLDEVTTIQQALPDHVDLAHYLMGTCSLHNIFLGMGRFPDGQVKPVSAPLERLVHIAEAGSSGFGKSTHMQTLAYQCLNAREAPKVVMLDPQAVTFTPFAGDERLKYPIASKEDNILAILAELVSEMEHRQQLFSQWRGVATLSQYNQMVSEVERLPQIPIFFDEFGLVADNKDIAKQVKKISQGGRKSGISLICGTQTWLASEITSSLRANLATSIQFYSRDKSTSRILLGDSAAAELLRPGQAYCRLPGQPGLVELQAPDPSSLIEVTPMLLPESEEMPTMPEPKPDEKEQEVLDLWDEYKADEAAIPEKLFGKIADKVFGHGGHQRDRVIKILQRFGRV